MSSGPNYNVIEGDWHMLQIIIADLSSRIIDEDRSFSDYLLADGSRALAGDWSLGNFNLTEVGNLTGTDIDISAGTGDYTTTGLGTFGSLIVDTDTLVVDAVNHRVGVLTDSPQADFDIGGLITPSVGEPTMLISTEINGSTGFEFRNTSTETSADTRILVSDTSGQYLAFSMPGVNNNAPDLFGVPRSEGSFIFNIGGTQRKLVFGALDVTDFILGTNNKQALSISGSDQGVSIFNDLDVGSGVFVVDVDTGAVTVGKIGLGPDQVANGDFLNWSGGLPIGWSDFTQGNAEITEVGANEGHGGIGTGAANLWTDDTEAVVLISPTIDLVIGKTYIFSFDVTKVVLNGVIVRDNVSSVFAQFTADEEQTYEITFVATDATMEIRWTRDVSATNITIDNVSVRQVFTVVLQGGSGTFDSDLTVNGTTKLGDGTNETQFSATGVQITKNATPYLTLHNSTEEDSDGGGESRIIFKREDGAGTETAAGQIEVSHDGVGANDQLGKMVFSVNTGAGLVDAQTIDSAANITMSQKLNVTGGVGVGIDPTAQTPFNAEMSINGVYQLSISNTDDSGNIANASIQVKSATGNFMNIISHGDGSTVSRWGEANLAGWGEILSINNPLAIGTSGEDDLILGTNSLKAITIAGDDQEITIEENLFVLASLTVNEFLSVEGSTRIGRGGVSNTHVINEQYSLPQVVGTTDYLVKQTGTAGKWDYVNPGTLDVATADAVAVVDAGDTDATFYLGLWDAASGDLEGKTDLGLTYNPSTNALMIGGDVEITGDLVVSTTALVVDSTNDHVGMGALATADAKVTIGGNEEVIADFDLLLGTSTLITETNPNLNFAAINYSLEVRGDQAVDSIAGVRTAIRLTSSFLGATISEICNFCVDENLFSATAKVGVVTIDNWYGYKMIVPYLGLGTTINTAYGLFFPELDVATTNWQIFSAGGDSFFGGKNFYGQQDGTIGVYSQADSFLDLFADGAVRIGDSSSGAPTNYTQFTNGLQTMAGDARVIKHLHFTMALGKGQNTPTVRFTEDPYVSYTYGIGDDSHLSREAPDDMDYTVASIVKVHWYTTDATAVGVDDVKWEVQWASQAVGEDITAGDTTDNSGDIVCSAANIIVETTAVTVPANSIANGDMVGIHIQRVAVAGSDPAGNSVHVIDVELEYTSNKLGEAL